MEKFIINTENEKITSINRTIRIKTEVFDKITELSEKTGVSFNKIITQCLDYALKNLNDN